MDIFDKYKEDRVPHELLYVLARGGMFVIIDIFAVIFSRVLCSAISTVLVIIFKTRFVTITVIPLINSDMFVSCVGYSILTGLMLWLFIDDGKRHTAYQRFSMPVTTLAVMVMFVLCVIPSIFLEDVKDSISAGISHAYKPCMWINTLFGTDEFVSAVIGAGFIAILCMLGYKLSGDRYLRKHPDAEYYEDFDEDSDEEEESEEEN